LFLSGNSNLRWDDDDLVVGGNLQIQGAATTISSSQVVFKDSILGLGFSGSNTFNNLGDRAVLLGRGTASGLVPGLSWDGTRVYTVNIPADPTSGSIDHTYRSAGVGGTGIPIPGYSSGEVMAASLVRSAYGSGSHAKALVFPVMDDATVYYPALSGTSEFEIDSGAKLTSLFTERLGDPTSQSVWNPSSGVAFLARGSNPGDNNNPTMGNWKFYVVDGSSSPGEINSYTGNQLGLNGAQGLHLTASSGHVEISGSAPLYIRTRYDNQASVGTSTVSWSDLFLASGGELHFNTDVDSSGVKIAHVNSSTSLIASGNLDKASALSTYGSAANISNATSGPGSSAFFTGPSTVSSSTTSLTMPAADSTDVSELQAGRVVELSGGGNTAYFLINTTPEVGDTTLSVTADNVSSWSGSTVSVSDAYDHNYIASRTAGIEYTLGVDGTAWRNLYVDNVDLNGDQTTGSFILDADLDTAIGSSADDTIDWFVGGLATSKFFMNATGMFPKANNSYDLGKVAKRYRNIYTGDVNLQNDRGDWTLIEENDFISFRDNMTGRRFRMVMEDITGMGNYGPGNDGEM
jgi:hypothetical protein